MTNEWDVIESGPADAEHTVLLLPGGMCHARSWTDVLAEPALQNTRLTFSRRWRLSNPPRKSV